MYVRTSIITAILCLITAPTLAQNTYAPKDEYVETINDIGRKAQMDVEQDLNRSLNALERNTDKDEMRDIIINNEAIKRRTARRMGETPPPPIRINLNDKQQVREYFDEQKPEYEELNPYDED